MGGKKETWDVLSLFFTSVVVWGHPNNPTPCNRWRHKYMFNITDQFFPSLWLFGEGRSVHELLVWKHQPRVTVLNPLICSVALPLWSVLVLLFHYLFCRKPTFFFFFFFTNNFFLYRVFKIRILHTVCFMSGWHISSFIILKHLHILLSITVRGCSRRCCLKQVSVNVNAHCPFSDCLRG